MTEFEKWWEKNKWKVERHNQRRYDFGAGWKGALEWTLSKKVSIDELIGKDGTEILFVIPSNDIEKELEVETR